MELYSDEYFMKEAIKEAQKAFDDGEVPVGAVVVSHNKIIARAYNQTERLNDATAHAEMLAITSATNHIGAKYLKDCTLYVTLEPCVMCAGALNWSQLSKLVFGAEDLLKGYRLINNQILHPKTTVISGIQSEVCKELLDKFFDKIREN